MDRDFDPNPALFIKANVGRKLLKMDRCDLIAGTKRPEHNEQVQANCQREHYKN